MKGFDVIKKKEIANLLVMKMSIDHNIFNLVFDAYNEYQESERDGVDYIFNMDNKDDLITCIKGGLTPEHIHGMIENKKRGCTNFFYFGYNHPIPEQLTFAGLKLNLIAYLDEIVDFIIAYPFDGACRKLYTILVTNPMIED